jgi:hypothetical protein
MHVLRRGDGEAARIGLAASNREFRVRSVTPAPSHDRVSDKVDLVCSSGHRTAHSLARVLRLNDGWCGMCGADISYEPGLGAVAKPALEPTGILSFARKPIRAEPDSVSGPDV